MKRASLKTYTLSLLIGTLLILPTLLCAGNRQLSFYIEQAKLNSPFIQNNKNENALLDLNLEQIRRVLTKPEANLEASLLLAPILSHDNNINRLQFISKGADNYNGFDLAGTDGGQYQSVVSIKQPLLNASKYKTYTTLNDVKHQINKNNIALSIHELEQLVTHQYILCLQAKQQSIYQNELLDTLKNQMDLLQQLVNSTLYKQTDLLLFKIEYQNRKADLERSLYEYKNSVYDLNLICGINDTSSVELDNIQLEINQSANSSSKFLTSYYLDSLSVVNQLNIDEIKYKPQFNFVANAGLNPVYLPSFNRLGASAGVTFSWNIYDGKQRDIARKMSVVTMQSIDFEKRQFAKQQTMQKNKVQNQINSIAHQLLIGQTQIEEYDQLLENYTTLLAVGEISVMDYKNLISDRVAKKQELIKLFAEKQVLINLYNYWNF